MAANTYGYGGLGGYGGYSGIGQEGNYVGGIASVLRRPSGGGLDLMAYARGRQEGDDMDWLRMNREALAEKMRVNKLAQNYVASAAQNAAFAKQNGIDMPTYYKQQREQYMADPYFQGLSATEQNAIHNTMASQVLLEAKAMMKSGDVKGAMALADAYNINLGVNPVVEAAKTGDLNKFVEAYNQQNGGNWTLKKGEDGQTYMSNGTMDLPMSGVLSQTLLSDNSLGWANIAQQQYNDAHGLSQAEAKVILMQSLGAPGYNQIQQVDTTKADGTPAQTPNKTPAPSTPAATSTQELINKFGNETMDTVTPLVNAIETPTPGDYVNIASALNKLGDKQLLDRSGFSSDAQYNAYKNTTAQRLFNAGYTEEAAKLSNGATTPAEMLAQYLHSNANPFTSWKTRGFAEELTKLLYQNTPLTSQQHYFLSMLRQYLDEGGNKAHLRVLDKILNTKQPVKKSAIKDVYKGIKY